jgi:hypothetical protein
VCQGAIRLTKEDGTSVESVVISSVDQFSVLNQVKGISLNVIRIIQDFPNVFSRNCKVCHPIETSSSLSCCLKPHQFQKAL